MAWCVIDHRRSRQQFARTYLAGLLAATIGATLGCGGSAGSAPVTAAPSATVRSSPTAAPPKSIIVERFSRVGDHLAVEIANPNTDVGLVRENFEAAALDQAGTTIQVFGTDGVAGAICCTIYNLPPGGKYGFDFALKPGASEVAKIEFTLPSPKWVRWSTIDPASISVTGTAVQRGQYSGATVTGRMSISNGGPFNVFAMAFVEDSTGSAEVIIADSVKCVSAGADRAFQLTLYGPELAPVIHLREVVAYPTTVTGAGVTQMPPGC